MHETDPGTSASIQAPGIFQKKYIQNGGRPHWDLRLQNASDGRRDRNGREPDKPPEASCGDIFARRGTPPGAKVGFMVRALYHLVEKPNQSL